MGASAHGGEARRPRGRRLLLLPLALGLTALGGLPPLAAGVPYGTTIEPAEGTTGYVWRPSAVTLAPGGTAAWRNPSTVTPHGLAWTGGPEKPSCSGIPVDSSGTNWSGSCTFAQAGTYTFVCTVHPEMQGTITVSSGETPAAPAPAPGQPSEPAAQGPLLQTLRLARLQRGIVVRGALGLSAAAAGGRLTLELRASRASLGATGAGTVRVGRLTRSPLDAGRQRFAIALAARARSALRRRGRLAVAVEISVAPPNAAAATTTRRVVLHV